MLKLENSRHPVTHYPSIAFIGSLVPDNATIREWLLCME